MYSRTDHLQGERPGVPYERLTDFGDLYRVLVETSTDLILVIDGEGRIDYANQAAEPVLGYAPEEMLGEHLSAFVTAEFEAQALSISERAARGRPQAARQIIGQRRDGSTVHLSLSAVPVDGTDQETRRAALTITDASAQERQERELVRDREQELAWELEWQRNLTSAVEGDRLLAYSQPVVDLRSGEPVQEELLVRMKGHGEEIVPPTEFLPTAERLDVVHAIDRWMLARALELVAAGRTVAVNVSARSLTELGLLDDAQRSLRSSGAEPSRLIFEITETSAAQNAEAAHHFADRAARIGCRLALDDFGTGFGAMTYLKSLPSHFLKIDMDFVRGLCSDEGNQRIVRTIVDIARRHGQRTIAEGVEDEETAALLRQYGVDFAQGHLFGKPAPID